MKQKELAEIKKPILTSFIDFCLKFFKIIITLEKFKTERAALQANIVFSFQIAYILTWVTYVILYSLIQCYLSALFCFFIGVVPSIIGIFVLKRNSNFFVAGLLSNFGSATALFLISFTTGGATSAVLPWLLAVLMGSYLQLGKVRGNFVTLYIALLFVFTTLYQSFGFPSFYELPFSQSSIQFLWFTTYNYVFTAFICALVIRIFVNQFEADNERVKLSEARVRELNQRLYLQSHTDELTSLYNRRAIYQYAQSQVNRALRTKKSLQFFAAANENKKTVFNETAEGKFKSSRDLTEYVGALSVAILDIDYFKKVNDQFGHNAGDAVLQKFAEILKSNLRDSDIIGRYGGEEFVVLFPDTGVHLAKCALEKLMKIVRELKIQIPAHQPIQITFSGGLVEMINENDNFESMISRADSALYLAKSTGRNCVLLG